MSSSFTQGSAVSRRTIAKSVVPAAALLLAGGNLARAQPANTSAFNGFTVRLPAPTGPHRIGATTLHLVDGRRRDPLDPAIPVREVMATVFYPARTVRGYPVARQMTARSAELFTGIDAPVHHLPVTGVNWAATTTHSRTGAPAQAVRRPVLLYSPGGGDPRTMGTGVAEELASRGYVTPASGRRSTSKATWTTLPTGPTGRESCSPSPGTGRTGRCS